MFTEVRRHKPSVVFIPQIDRWYATLGDGALTALTTMLQSLPPTDPILLLATTDLEANELDKALVRDLFSYSRKNRAAIARPSTVSIVTPKWHCLEANNMKEQTHGVFQQCRVVHQEVTYRFPRPEHEKEARP